MNQFKSLADVANYFNHEDKARTFLEKLRWPDGRIICPLCGVGGGVRLAVRGGLLARYHAGGNVLVRIREGLYTGLACRVRCVGGYGRG